MGQGFPSQRLGVNISAGTGLAQTGTVVFSNSNGVTFGMATSASSFVVTASVSATVVAIQSISAGTTRITSGEAVFSNSNGISFGVAGNTVTATADYVRSISAGTTNATGNQIVFSNSNSVSFGANGATITASISTLPETPFAISAGTQSVSTGTVVFSNSNGVTFGMSGSSRITATVDAIKSISAGTTRITSGEAVFSNSNGFSFGVNGQTITATYERRVTAFSQWAEFGTNFSISNATLSLQKVSMPMHLSATRAVVLMDLTGNSGSTGALTVSMAVYTLSGSTASLASSASRQISWTSGSETTASSIYGGVSGTRYRTLGINVSMTPGDYLFGFHFRTTNNGTWRAFGRQAVSIVGTYDGVETDYFIDGTSNSSFTTAFPASVVATNTNYARTGAPALRQPGVILIGTF